MNECNNPILGRKIHGFHLYVWDFQFKPQFISQDFTRQFLDGQYVLCTVYTVVFEKMI